MNIYKPHDYQREAENFIYENDEAGLFLDMGLGKTVTTLTALSKLQWDISRVLVIAPKRPAVDTWPEELQKWDHLKDLSFSIAVGSEKERIRAVEAGSYITIINRENVVWLVNRYKKEAWPFDCVVIDELSSFKSSRSQRFRALKRMRPYIKRVIGLTGTPMSNGYMDLWAECFILDGGKALGKTLTGYRDQFFTPGRRNGAIVYDWNLRAGAAEDIQNRIKPLCVTMKTEDYLELPEMINIEKVWSLSDKSRKLYEKMEKELFLEVAGSEIDAVNAAALTGKLLQITSGAVYDADGKTAGIHDEKLEVLDSLIEEAEGENVLVFYSFRHELQRLLERYPEAVDIKSPGAIEKWKQGKIKVLLAHPASAGHGLNLQSGGSISIWLSLTTSLELYQQSLKRLHRQGQTRPVRNYVMLSKGTYEETVYRQILQRKEKQQSALIDALKLRMKEVKSCR